MLLTIYYVAATFMQSWKIRKIYNQITSKLAEKSSVVFYNLTKEGNESNITSELCVNHTQARVSDILWLRDNQRGCSLMPLQIVHLGPWVTFPESPINLIPFEFNNNNNIDGDEKLIELDLDPSNQINLLLETDIVPLQENEVDDIIMIEQYGKPVAWKVDSHFAVILESDINHLIKLLMATFMQNNFSINDRLPLIRIESIQCEGKPQPFDLLKNHLRKQLISRAMRHLSIAEWDKHLSGLRSLSILANQATEFEYNKNRTEGKTGVVKPDLIPSTSSSSPSPSHLKNIKDTTITDSNSSHLIEKKSSSPVKDSPVKSITEMKVSPNKQALNQSSNKIEMEASSSTSSSPSKDVISKVSPKKVINNSNTDATNISKLSNDSNKSPKKSVPTDKVESVDTINSVENNEAEIKSDDATVEEIKNEKLEKDDDDEPIIPRPIPKASECISLSSNRNNSKRPSLVRNKGSLMSVKPPNVLVYSESINVRDSVIDTLKSILEQDVYTVYPLPPQQVKQKIWVDNTCLLIVCGSVEAPKAEVLVDYFIQGGKMLSLCSDLLHIIVPTYRTAEVREHELAQFSYDKWQKIKMMHHIFCYQPSPVKKHFSTEEDFSSSSAALSKKPALVCPRSVEVKDLQGELHNLDVKVLGIEETWNTPSLLLANNVKSGGKAVFSQVHLEVDPNQYESDETKFNVLKQNDKARLEILSDLLKHHLDILTRKIDDRSKIKDFYKPGYFLGRHESKFELLGKLRPKMESENLIKVNNYLTIKFFGKGEQLTAASKEFLPISTLSCPEDFSTVEYFDNLKTKSIGRLVIYVPVVTSSMAIVSNLNLTDGIAVIPKQQTGGMGRSSNQWLSPEGCAMFSLQLHIPINSIIGQKLSLIQHLITVSLIKAVIEMDGYENLDIRLKWPNDIYANGITKIGGVSINSQIIPNADTICNIGCAINLNNSSPTTCLNDLVKEYNRSNNKNLQLIKYEKLLATTFNTIEKLLGRIQKGDLAKLYELYYKYWLHGEQEVLIVDKSGHEKTAKIVGIDEYGFLEVQTPNGKVESVQSDGNTFDMLRGLISPK